MCIGVCVCVCVCVLMQELSRATWRETIIVVVACHCHYNMHGMPCLVPLSAHVFHSLIVVRRDPKLESTPPPLGKPH